MLRIDPYRINDRYFNLGNLHIHHFRKKRISSVYNSDNLKDISTSEEVLSTMVKEPTERISKEMCLENWSIEGRQLGTENSDPSRKRVKERFLRLVLKCFYVN